MTGRYRRKGTKENTTRMGGDFLEEGTDCKGSPALANVTKSQIKDVLHPSRKLNRSIFEIININDYLFSRKKGTMFPFSKRDMEISGCIFKARAAASCRVVHGCGR